MERCRLCAQKTNLCKSHVISNFVVRETRGKGGGAKLLNITSEESPRVARDQNQNTEYLLCRRCEDKRQEWEGIVAATIVGKGNGREIRPRISVDLNGEGQFKNVRYGPLKLWVLSTIYLMHCTQKKVGHWVRLTGEEKARMRSRLRDGQPGSDLDFQIFGRVTLRSNATQDLEGGWIRPGATSEYAPGRLQTRAVHFYMLDIEWFVLLGDWPDNPMREARLKEDGTWRTSMEYDFAALSRMVEDLNLMT